MVSSSFRELDLVVAFPPVQVFVGLHAQGWSRGETQGGTALCTPHTEKEGESLASAGFTAHGPAPA